MNTKDLFEKLKNTSSDDLLSRATNLYVATLPEQLRTAIYCGAILRWFDDRVLEAVLVSKQLEDIGRSFGRETASTAYAQLKRLTFTETYPMRGFSFHELTRKSLLDHLWTEEKDFYRAVSGGAYDYFSLAIKSLTPEQDADGIVGEIDWGLVVEMLYHQIIVDEENALQGLDEFMSLLITKQHLGVHHDMIIALDDHIKGGRLRENITVIVNLWKAREAYSNWELDTLLKLAVPLSEADEESVAIEISLEALDLLGRTALRCGNYQEARHYFQKSLTKSQSLDDANAAVRSLVDLGDVAMKEENYSECRRLLDEALRRWVEANRIPASDDSDLGNDTPLNFQSPLSWSRQEMEETRSTEEEDGDFANEYQENELETSADEAMILYFIRTEDGSPVADSDDADPGWPIFINGLIPEIWLSIAYLDQAEENYDGAVAGARLAGMIYSDMEDLSGALDALSLLESLGAAALDHAFVKFTQEYRHILTKKAAAGSEKQALFQGLISEANSLVKQANLHEARQKWNEALSIAVDLDSDSHRATCLEGLSIVEDNEGHISESRDSIDSAIALYKKIQNREGLASALVTRSQFESNQREFSEAMRFAYQALEIYQDLKSVLGQFDVFQRIASVLILKGEYEKAFEFHQKALEIARSYKRMSLRALVQSTIADLELSLGRKAEAEVNYQYALNIARNSKQHLLKTQILLDKSIILTDQAEYEKANASLNRLFEADPENHEAWNLKGWCLEQLGSDRVEEAVHAYEMAIKFAPEVIYVHKGLADALQTCGKYEEADRKRRWVLEKFGSDPKPFELSALGWCYYKLGDYETAMEIFGRAKVVSSLEASDQFDVALVNLSLGRHEEAVQGYEQAILEVEKVFPPLRRLGLLFIAKRDLYELLAKMPTLNGSPVVTKMQELLTQAKTEAHS